TAARADSAIHTGVTTIEVKSGYGLDVDNELKMLRAIAEASSLTSAELIPTCLAAHIKPPDFAGNEMAYLNHIITTLLPIVRNEQLADRTDIFIEESAFSQTQGTYYLREAQQLGFSL